MKNLLLTLAVVLSVITTQGQTQVTDYDGNIYQTVTLGTQLWMAENLRTTHYSDGSLIPNNCWYDNTVTDSIYGKLYRWEAAMKNATLENAQGACMIGWHIPTDKEWIQLFDFVSDSNSCAPALKDTNSSYWSPPLIASNTTGFNLLGAGHGYACISFQLLGTHAEFWTSTEINNLSAKNWATNNQSGTMFRHYNQDKSNNFSVRCISDRIVSINEQESTNLLTVFPNPLSTQTVIRTNVSLHNATLTVTNVLGQTMKQIENISGQTVILLRDNLEAGLYLIQISQGNQVVASKKIMITN